jgi:hypothetical protein
MQESADREKRSPKVKSADQEPQGDTGRLPGGSQKELAMIKSD